MKNTKYYMELAARWYVFSILTIYATGKLMGGQFYLKDELPAEVASQTLDNVKSFDLAWTFMGHSYAYILFIGISQLIGATMLLFEKTKLLGIAILIPILVNIIVFDAIFFETNGALCSATLYLTLLLFVLYLNKDRIIELVQLLVTSKSLKEDQSSIIKVIGFTIVVIAVFFGFDQLMLNIVGR